MGARRADLGALAAGILFLAVAALFLHTALSGTEALPFAYQAAVFVAGFALVLLVRGLFRSRR
ncbi:hypothetical protein ABGB12_31100 [Actinocorallia sp. B10E7]|uniref:hypothetical protein n=1 Tax=Actinocorallia sp. B10E7 TaxID=3153558 RepID=UPI00325E100E